jgi:outer membrane protein assembly factor BamD
MMKRFRTRSSGLAALVALPLMIAGCSARQENLSLLPADDLFARGVAAMERGDYDDAIPLFDYFVIQHLGDPRAPEARVLLADSHMEEREYATAASHYQRLVNDHPFHELSLKARFRTCEAYYLLSPNPQLDQEYTVSAILHCQSVAEYYPGTEEARTATAYVEELQNKLAKKLYDTGVHYFRRGAYDAAVVYLEDTVELYPDSPVAPPALSRLVETYTRMGYVEDAEETRQRLLRDYPQSPEARSLAGTE